MYRCISCRSILRHKPDLRINRWYYHNHRINNQRIIEENTKPIAKLCPYCGFENEKWTTRRARDIEVNSINYRLTHIEWAHNTEVQNHIVRHINTSYVDPTILPRPWTVSYSREPIYYTHKTRRNAAGQEHYFNRDFVIKMDWFRERADWRLIYFCKIGHYDNEILVKINDSFYAWMRDTTIAEIELSGRLNSTIQMECYSDSCNWLLREKTPSAIDEFNTYSETINNNREDTDSLDEGETAEDLSDI